MNKNFIETFDQTTGEYFEASRKTRRVCIDMLVDICNRTDSKRIDLTQFNKYRVDSGYFATFFDRYCDGHTVNGFRFEEDMIVFSVTGDDYYNEHMVLLGDLVTLCRDIIEYEKTYTLGVKEYEQMCRQQ